jgi:hypothetical protein
MQGLASAGPLWAEMVIAVKRIDFVDPSRSA